MRFRRHYLILTFFIHSCTKEPFVTLTNEYLEVRNLPEAAVIYEMNVTKVDSIYQYPIEENLVSVYSVVRNDTRKPLKGHFHFKVYFSKENKPYCWEEWKNPPLLKYNYLEKLHLNEKTWYKVRNEKEQVELYLIIDSIRKFRLIRKPMPPKGPW